MSFKSYVIFFLLFGLLPDLYLVLFSGLPLYGIGILTLPTLAALVSLVYIGRGAHYTAALRVFSYLIFLFELPKLIYALVSAVGKLLPGSQEALAIGLGCGVAFFFAYLIFYSSRHLRVNSVELRFENLPVELDGLRLALLADLHLGSNGKKAPYVTRVVDTVLARKPELVLFAGDLVNFESSEADSYVEELSRIKAPLGVFAIRGNHDYLLHGPHDEAGRVKDMERLLALEKKLGWRVLLNEHVIVKEKLAIVGVENVSDNPYFRRMGGDLGKALEGLPEGVFAILLSHDPSHWRSGVLPSTNIPLTLSGHTHGLKYKLAGIDPSHWKLPHSFGQYVEGKQVLHVSKGLGSAFAFRLGGFPEVDIITLKTNN